MDHASRRCKLRQQLGLDLKSIFLVTNLTNVHYLTGFSGSAAWLLISSDQQILLSDPRYTTQIEAECPDLEVVIRAPDETLLTRLGQVIQSGGWQVIHCESEHISKSDYDAIENGVSGSQLGIELVSVQGIVEELRMIKDDDEIGLIRKSIEINQRVFDILRLQLTSRHTERQIAHLLEQQMRQMGASGVSFEPLVAVGSRSALPHARPGEQQVADSPFLLVDWGTSFQGYASDLTRMTVTGKLDAKFEEIYHIVKRAHDNAIAAIYPGQSYNQVDAAARKTIADAGYGEFFGHGLGHGFGLEVHERPRLSPISNGQLKPGMVVTVEPGIYLPGWGGIRIEDDILVTPDGYQVLSSLPNDLESCYVSLIS